MNAESAMGISKIEKKFPGHSVFFANDCGQVIVHRSENGCENDGKGWYDCETGEAVRDLSILKNYYYYANITGGLVNSDAWVRNLKNTITKKSQKIPSYRKKGLETIWLYVCFEDVDYLSEQDLCEHIRCLNASLDHQFDIIFLSTSKALCVIGETIAIYDAKEYKIKKDEIDRVLEQKSDHRCH